MDNGVWLCQTCAKLMDSDTRRYTTAVIRGWKREAERTAHQELESRMPPAAPSLLEPLYVHHQFNDHPPLLALARELAANGFQSSWVPLREARAKRTLGYIEQYFEGREVRTEIDRQDHVWMVQP